MFKLYHGNENYISLREAQREISKLKQDTSTIIEHIDASTKKPEDFVDTISSQNLFSPRKIFFVKRIYKNRNKELIIEYLLENLEKTDITLIIWEDQKINGTTKYLKFFKKNNSIEEYDKLNRRSFVSWAKKEVESTDLKFTPDSLNLLCELTNYEPERFLKELEKLILTEEKEITKEMLEKNTADTLEFDIWKFIDKLNSEKDNKEAVKILERLLNQNIDPNYIIAMIARNLRLIVLTQSLIQKRTNTKDIASILKIPPFTVYPLLNASKKYTFERLKLLYEKLSNLDYEIKIGRIEAKLGLSLFCTMI